MKGKMIDIGRKIWRELQPNWWLNMRDAFPYSFLCKKAIYIWINRVPGKLLFGFSAPAGNIKSPVLYILFTEPYSRVRYKHFKAPSIIMNYGAAFPYSIQCKIF